jgi:hypothetical protein
MINKLLSRIGIVALLTGLCNGAMAQQSYGWVEKIRVQPWDVEAKAKLDSGALTSSMHARDIELFQRDDENWVRFTIELGDDEEGQRVTERIERPLFREFSVRGAGGRDQRAVVLMEICIGNTVYEEQFSLRNRSNMNYPVLLGRRTIQHLGPIDVTRTFLTDSDCGSDARVLSYNETEKDEGIGVN